MNRVRVRRTDRILDSIWHIAAAPQTLMALAGLLAGTLAFAALIPQQPAGLDSATAERWLAAAAGSYRGTGTFLRTVGAFDLLNGAWVRGLLAALAFNLALRAASQARMLTGLRRPVQLRPAPAGLPRQRGAFPIPLAQALARCEAVLRGRGFRVAVASDATHAQLYAERGGLAAAGPLLSYLGGLLLLTGLALNAAGWRAADLALAPGGAAPLGQAAGTQVTLTEIADDTATLALARGNAHKIIRIGYARPGHWGGIWLTQGGAGPALAVSAADADQLPLRLQSLVAGGEEGETLRMLFPQAQSEQAFAIPARNLAFRVVSYPALPERDITGPVFLVEGFRGDDPAPALNELVAEAGTLALDEVTLTLRRDRYAVIEVAYLPGLLPALAGALLLLAGALLAARRGPARLWAALTATGETVAVTAHAAAALDPGAEAAHLFAAVARDDAGEAPDAG